MLNPDIEVEEEMSFRRFRKIAKRDYCLRQVCPSVRLEQLSSNWTDIYEIRYPRIFKKFCPGNSSCINVWEGQSVLYMKTMCVFHNILLNSSHLTLGKWTTWCTIALYNTFIIIILYMFRAALCLSSGGRIVLVQHMLEYSEINEWSKLLKHSYIMYIKHW